jgi:23S rRNA (uracil1939-C5)-methyltransferase
MKTRPKTKISMTQPLRAKIEKLVYGGEGLAHAEGHTLFVPFVLPGEEVLVRPVQSKPKLVRGRVENLITASPERIAAPCPYFTRCGGCHYQHIPYPAQLNYKEIILRESLRRLGRIEWTGPVTTHASPPLGYRNRAQWKVRRIEGEATPSIGYFEAASSALCAVDECALLSPRLAGALAALRDLLRSGKLASLREVEVFCDAEDDRLLVTAAFTSLKGATPDAMAEVLHGAMPGIESLLLHDTSSDRFELRGPGFLHYRAGNFPHRVGHLSFFQVNRFLVDTLREGVTRDAAGKFAVDLFAGVGLFSLLLAQKFERVTAVEGNPAAVRDLTENLRVVTREGARAEAVNQEADTFLARCRESPDLIVLDPPRAGLTADVVRHLLLSVHAPEIRYLSCSPATLARDLAALTAGYEIAEVSLFDLFPQTYHLETLVRLKRRK